MSLILEALKKSEARRQLGETPGLGTPFTVARRRRSVLPFVIVLIVLAVGFGAWFLRRQAPQPTAANPAVGGAAPVAPRTDASPRAPNVLAPARPSAPGPAASMPAAPAPIGVISPFAGNTAAMPAQRRAAPAAANAAAARPPGEAVAQRERAPAARRGADVAAAGIPAAAPRAQSPVAESQLRMIAHSATAPAPGAIASGTGMPKAPAPVVIASGTGTPKTPAPAVIASGTGTPKAPPPAQPTAPPPAAAPAPPAATAAANMPLYYELPYELRRDLPALVISMHVFAAAPAQRFIVVDGERKAEGDTIKEGLTLREIRNDGVVLEFRGQRFFYPRPGR